MIYEGHFNYKGFKKSTDDPEREFFKYEDKLFSEPVIMVRRDGDWIIWCGSPKSEEILTNKLKLGDYGGLCFSVRETETTTAEVNFVVDFITKTFSIKSDLLKEKATGNTLEIDEKWDCELCK